MSVLKILKTLEENRSRNFKILELKRNFENPDLQQTIFLALDPFTNFYIRKIPEYKSPATPEMKLSDTFIELIKLSNRVVTGNAAIAHLKMILSSVSADDAQVIERIIGKDLRCGVSIKTVNDVWEKFIHEYPVMLCTPFDVKLMESFHFPAEVQLKCDGMRMNAIVRHVPGGSANVDFRSRAGKEVFLFNELQEDFIKLSKGEDCVFDGEFVVKRLGKIIDRKTGNGILNKAVRGTISKEEAATVCAIVWDKIPLPAFRNGMFTQDYYNRLRMLKQNPNWTDRVELIKTESVDDLSQAEFLFNKYLEDGEEGIILKSLRGSWEAKRVKHQIKFKDEKECDLKCIGIIPGEGKYVGMIGALQLQSDDTVLNVAVGSGLSDDDRKRPEEEFLGHIITVKYNTRIADKEGRHSLFLPRYVEVRLDKTQADSSTEVK